VFEGLENRKNVDAPDYYYTGNFSKKKLVVNRYISPHTL